MPDNAYRIRTGGRKRAGDHRSVRILIERQTCGKTTHRVAEGFVVPTGHECEVKGFAGSPFEGVTRIRRHVGGCSGKGVKRRNAC